MPQGVLPCRVDRLQQSGAYPVPWPFARVSDAPASAAGERGRPDDLAQEVRYPGAERKAKELAVTLRQPQLVANEITTRTKARLLLALLDQLEPLMRQIADYDQEIERLF